MLSVYQSWDKLNKCLLGSTYPPEFYSFIKNSKVRNVFEKISLHTLEDLEVIQIKLESFGVEVYRPTLHNDLNYYKVGDKFLPPPLTPRDDIGVFGNNLFMPQTDKFHHWRLLENSSWNVSPPQTKQDWDSLPLHIKESFAKHMQITCVEDLYYRDYSGFKHIELLAKELGNNIVYDEKIDSAMICRVGKDLYSGLWPGQNIEELKLKLRKFFPDYRSHIIDTQGHLDGVFAVLAPGLILANSDLDLSVFQKHFPDWEVITIKHNNGQLFRNFENLKQKNRGKWLVKGEENNNEFIDFVEMYITNWLGFAEETSVGVNVLMIDQHNMLCTQEDEVTFKRLEKYNIKAHVVPFRHVNFWDSGVHCLTADLQREGECEDFFPNRAESQNTININYSE